MSIFIKIMIGGKLIIEHSQHRFEPFRVIEPTHEFELAEAYGTQL